jgi:hypothetical protein
MKPPKQAEPILLSSCLCKHIIIRLDLDERARSSNDSMAIERIESVQTQPRLAGYTRYFRIVILPSLRGSRQQAICRGSASDILPSVTAIQRATLGLQI